MHLEGFSHKGTSQLKNKQRLMWVGGKRSSKISINQDPVYTSVREGDFLINLKWDPVFDNSCRFVTMLIAPASASHLRIIECAL